MPFPLPAFSTPSYGGSGSRMCGDPAGPKLAPHAMVLRDRTPPERNSLGAPHPERPVVAGTRRLVSPHPTGPETVGLAPERAEFRTVGFPDPVIQTLELARAPSPRVAYAFLWGKWTPRLHITTYPAVPARAPGPGEIRFHPQRRGSCD